MRKSDLQSEFDFILKGDAIKQAVLIKRSSCEALLWLRYQLQKSE